MGGATRIVEEALADQLVGKDVPNTHEEKVRLLSELLDRILVPDSSLGEGEYKPVRRGWVVKGISAHPLLVDALRHVVLMEKTALGIIEPLIRDPYIEDISCDGVGPLFLEHK